MRVMFQLAVDSASMKLGNVVEDSGTRSSRVATTDLTRMSLA